MYCMFIFVKQARYPDIPSIIRWRSQTMAWCHGWQGTGKEKDFHFFYCSFYVQMQPGKRRKGYTHQFKLVSALYLRSHCFMIGGMMLVVWMIVFVDNFSSFFLFDHCSRLIFLKFCFISRSTTQPKSSQKTVSIVLIWWWMSLKSLYKATQASPLYTPHPPTTQILYNLTDHIKFSQHILYNFTQNILYNHSIFCLTSHSIFCKTSQSTFPTYFPLIPLIPHFSECILFYHLVLLTSSRTGLSHAFLPLSVSPFQFVFGARDNLQFCMCSHVPPSMSASSFFPLFYLFRAVLLAADLFLEN